MPSTSSRAVASSQPPSYPSAVAAAPLSPSRGRGTARVSESDILENAYGIPSLHSTHSRHTFATGGAASPPKKLSGHGRSMSHPFPSLFSGKKKRNGGSGENTNMSFDPTDENPNVPTIMPTGLPIGASSKSAKVSDKDLTTGKCMTCDSTVRWPKDLKVFRCTVCLTVNDLKLSKTETRREEDRSSTVRPGTIGGHRGTTKGR
jgi:E3 ubiquitin-protein ligase HECTD2